MAQEFCSKLRGLSYDLKTLELVAAVNGVYIYNFFFCFFLLYLSVRAYDYVYYKE